MLYLPSKCFWQCRKEEALNSQTAAVAEGMGKGFPLLNTSIGDVVVKVCTFFGACDVHGLSSSPDIHWKRWLLGCVSPPLHWHSISLVLRCSVHTNSR